MFTFAPFKYLRISKDKKKEKDIDVHNNNEWLID